MKPGLLGRMGFAGGRRGPVSATHPGREAGGSAHVSAAASCTALPAAAPVLGVHRAGQPRWGLGEPSSSARLFGRAATKQCRRSQSYYKRCGSFCTARLGNQSASSCTPPAEARSQRIRSLHGRHIRYLHSLAQTQRQDATQMAHGGTGASCAWAHHVLHLCCDVERQIRGRAARAPGDVAEGGAVRCHPVLPVKQVLHALRRRRRHGSAQPCANDQRQPIQPPLGRCVRAPTRQLAQLCGSTRSERVAAAGAHI